MENPDTEQTGRAKLWLQAARPFSFTASMVPVLVQNLLSTTGFETVRSHKLSAGIVEICVAHKAN